MGVDGQPRILVAGYLELVDAALDRFSRGELTSALEALERARHLDPDNAEAWHHAGMMLCSAGETRRGLQLLRMCLERDPDWYDTWNQVAWLSGKERPAAGVAVYRQMIHRWPNDFTAWHNLACLLRDMLEIEDSLACFRRAEMLDGSHPALFYNLGKLMYGCGRVDEARGCFERALALDPDFEAAKTALRTFR